MKDLRIFIWILLYFICAGTVCIAEENESDFFNRLMEDSELKQSFENSGENLIYKSEFILIRDMAFLEEKDIDTIEFILNKMSEENRLDDFLKQFEEASIQQPENVNIMFVLSLIYNRKDLVEEEYIMLSRIEEVVKNYPETIFNLNFVYDRKESLEIEYELDSSELLAGSISVKTFPSGAKVYINGDYKGTSPCVIENIETGEYQVKAELPGYMDSSMDVTVSLGSEQNVSLSLKELAQQEPVLEGFAYVKGGNFLMGSTTGEEDEQPVHEITVNTFFMGKYEVTFEQYDRFCEDTGRNKPDDKGRGRGNRPVTNVNWYDAVAFCNWLSIRDGLTPCYSGSDVNIRCDFTANGYRLPTEAEWEFAATGGIKSEGYVYSGSNSADSIAWYWDNSGGANHPVGEKSPNELGLYDMSGNLWEWCWDWYNENYYTVSPGLNPEGSDTGSYRVLRGGSWYESTSDLRCASRSCNFPLFSSQYIGFRLVRKQ
jgi:sulfatase modifying factor 1